MAVYPFVVGDPFPVGRDATAHDRAGVVDLLARVHDTDPAQTPAGVDDLAVPYRGTLEHALDRLRQPWRTGPYGEVARELLADNAASVRTALHRYDRLVAGAALRATDRVVTHGEPKADNLLVSAHGLRLVDWDTALLAPAARDLWLVESGSGAELDRYTALTDRRVHRDELHLYRLRWDLSDIAEFLGWFAAPHRANGDTEIAWQALSQLLPTIGR